MSEGFITIQDSAVSDEVKKSYTHYGEDVLETKFPSGVDGLKNITRRIVFFTSDSNETKGMNKIIGNIGDVHTAGDGSIYGAIVRLAQDFMVNKPLIHIDGKSGEYDNPSGAAAPRYLKAKLSNFCQEVYFKDVDIHTIPMMPTKNFMDREPKHLIPRLPMALILGNLTVGLGFKSSVPMYSFSDVCDVVVEFSKIMKNNFMPEIISSHDCARLSKRLMPCFPIKNLVVNDEELKRNYASRTFKCPIKLEGFVELSGSAIVVRCIPYGNHMSTIVDNVYKALSDSKNPINNYIQAAKQYSTSEAEFHLPLKRGVNPFEVLDFLRPLIKLNDTFSPYFSFVKDNRVVELDPIDVLNLWYRERYNSIAGGLRYRQKKCLADLDFQRALLIISDRADEVIDIVKSSDNVEEAVKKLSAAFTDLTQRQAYIISQSSISTLTKNTKQEALRKIADLENTLKSISVEFTKIHETIQSDALYFKRKYPETKITQYAKDFKGYVKFGNWGIINFFDQEDMYEILNSKWPSSVKKTIHIYKPNTDRYVVKGGRLSSMVNTGRQVSCDDVVCYRKSNGHGYTLALGDEGSTSVVARDVREVHSGYRLLPISSTFYGIHRNGTISVEHVKDYSLRKSVSSGARTDLIYALPERSSNLVVFHMNPSQPNILRADVILTSSDKLGRLVTAPEGTTHILGVHSINSSEVYLNIPDNCVKSLAMEYLQVLGMKDTFKSSTKFSYTLDLGKQGGLSKKLKRNHTVRTLYTLDLRNTNIKEE